MFPRCFFRSQPSRRLAAWLAFGGMTAATPLPLARAQDGAVDLHFNAGGQGASDDIYDAALLPESRGVLIAGHFTSYNGRERWRLARLQPDGALDESLDPRDSTGAAPISRVAALPDGKSLVAGPFNKFDGRRRHLLARLGADGALDAGFDPNRALGGGSVSALAILSDGKILVGGRVESPADGGRARALVRLLADGRLDEGFSAAIALVDPADKINALAPLPGGKLLAAGRFSLEAGTGDHGTIVRLEADGRVDPGFHPPAGLAGPAKALTVQADGKILLAMAPSDTDDRPPRRLLVRLNADGSPDAGFAPGEGEGAGGSVEALAVQSDGKVLVGGSFHRFGGAGRDGLARLNADGSLDRSFDPGTGVSVLAIDDPDETPEPTVRVILPLPGGGLLIAGRFDLYNGAPCHNVARLRSGAAPVPPPSNN